jgi:hypothetical protein
LSQAVTVFIDSDPSGQIHRLLPMSLKAGDYVTVRAIISGVAPYDCLVSAQLQNLNWLWQMQHLAGDLALPYPVGLSLNYVN